MDFVDDAAMDSRSPQFSPAAGETGKDLDVCRLGQGQRDDSVLRQITPVVEGARIAVIARREDFGGKPQALSIAECASGHYALIRLARPLRLLIVDVDAQAGIDREALAVSYDLFGFDLDPLPDAASAIFLRRALLGDMGSDHELCPIGKSKHAGISRLFRATDLNHERSQKKQRSPSHNQSCLAPPPEPVRARPGKDGPCDHPPEWRPPGMNTSGNTRGKGERGPEQWLPSTWSRSETGARVGWRIHKIRFPEPDSMRRGSGVSGRDETRSPDGRSEEINPPGAPLPRGIRIGAGGPDHARRLPDRTKRRSCEALPTSPVP